MLKSLLIFLVTCASTRAFAQGDTIPVVLQRTPVPPQISQVAYRGNDSILMVTAGKLLLSTNAGTTFIVTDSTSGMTGAIYVTSSGPLYRIDRTNASRIELSRDAGHSWLPPVSEEHARMLDNISTDDTRLAFYDLSQNRDFVTSNEGASWDTLVYSSGSNQRPTLQAWYDAAHGIEFHQGHTLLSTSDSGRTWDTLLAVGDTSQYTNGILDLSQSIQYPAPGVIAIIGFAYSGEYVSLDTGHTWSFSHSVESNIEALGNANWLGLSQSGAVVPNTLERSTDRGKSWQVVPYTCPNAAGAMAFSDSLHGVMLGNTITLGERTSDGGRTWECLDTTLYTIGAGDYINSEYILPDRSQPNTYYALASAYNRIYLCRSVDRGASWTLLFPIPWSPIEGYSVPLLLGNRFFFPYSGSIRWTEDDGATYHEKDFLAAFQTEGGFVIRGVDGTLWAGNAGTLLISNDSGDTWNDGTEQLPDYNPDSTYSYQFQIVDSLTGFATLGDTIFRTMDGGMTWRRDSIMPDYVIDSRDWVWLPRHEKTTDAGATWTTFVRPPASTGTFFPVDSKRWYYFSSYTGNAGMTWQPIPGWRSGLTVVDSATAFSTNAPPLLRLDLPFKGAAESVEQRLPTSFRASASPNPASDMVTLSFSFVNSGTAHISIMNMLGTVLSSQDLGSIASGEHSVELSLAGLPAGIYYARVSSGEESQMVKIVKE